MPLAPLTRLLIAAKQPYPPFMVSITSEFPIFLLPMLASSVSAVGLLLAPKPLMYTPLTSQYSDDELDGILRSLGLSTGDTLNRKQKRLKTYLGLHL